MCTTIPATNKTFTLPAVSYTTFSVPVKKGETIWDAQARIEKKSDENATQVGIAKNINNGEKSILTNYYNKEGKKTGEIYVGNGTNGKTSTAITEYDNNSELSGTRSYDDDNNGTIDRKEKFCGEVDKTLSAIMYTMG